VLTRSGDEGIQAGFEVNAGGILLRFGSGFSRAAAAC
jgi:hypothetical protein